ncbi:hypothetical protein GQ457_01G010340 [Hibiscus cannabinus]
MKNLKEAERVIQRLHGFTLYGLKLSVKRARNNYGWKRIVAGRTQVTNNWTMESGDGLSKGHDEGGAATESMLANNAGLWGSFEALGENDKHTMDREKVRVLIATNQVKRIKEIIDVEVGNNVFQMNRRVLPKSDMARSKTEDEVDRSGRSGRRRRRFRQGALDSVGMEKVISEKWKSR